MLTNATVADLLRPCEKRLAGFYDVALIIGGSLLIGLCAHAKVWLPFSPVPVTGQTFAVLMIGALLGSRRGCLAVLAYIIEGAAGLPVFAVGIGSVYSRRLHHGKIGREGMGPADRNDGFSDGFRKSGHLLIRAALALLPDWVQQNGLDIGFVSVYNW